MIWNTPSKLEVAKWGTNTACDTARWRHLILRLLLVITSLFEMRSLSANDNIFYIFFLCCGTLGSTLQLGEGSWEQSLLGLAEDGLHLLFVLLTCTTGGASALCFGWGSCGLRRDLKTLIWEPIRACISSWGAQTRKTPGEVELAQSGGREWEKGFEQKKQKHDLNWVGVLFLEGGEKVRGSCNAGLFSWHPLTVFSCFPRMSERYTQVGSKGALLVMVLVASLWEIAAPTEATEGERNCAIASFDGDPPLCSYTIV